MKIANAHLDMFVICRLLTQGRQNGDSRGVEMEQVYKGSDDTSKGRGGGRGGRRWWEEGKSAARGKRQRDSGADLEIDCVT